MWAWGRQSRRVHVCEGSAPTLCVRLASAARTPLSCVHVFAPVLCGMTELAEQPLGGELCKASSLQL
jgi:hypothetical protein